MTPPLLRLVSRSAGSYAGVVVLWIVLRTAILMTGLLLQQVFDRITGGQTAGLTVASLVAAVVAVEAAKIALWYGVILSRIEPYLTYGVRSGLQANALRQLMRRPSHGASDRAAGDSVARFGGDTDEVGVFVIWSASNVARLVIAVVAVAIMVAVDPVVTLGMVVPVTAMVLASQAVGRRLGRYQRAGRDAATEVSTIVGEAVAGVQAVQVARAEDRVVSRLRRANDTRLRIAVREALLTAIQTGLFSGTAALGTGFVLLLAASALRAGTFTVGDLALFVFYIQFITEAVTALGTSLGRYQKADVSVHRVADLAGGMEAVIAPAVVHLRHDPPASGPDVPDPPTTPLRELTVEGLGYHYPGTPHGVRNVDLCVPGGGLTVVTGRVGAGKSTLLRVVLGLLPADSGVVRWNGSPVRNRDAFLVPPTAAYVPQAPRLFSGTVRENILLGADVPADVLEEAVRLAALDEDLAELENGLDTIVGARGRRLSGGQIQRVAAARALVRRSELLVVDDLSNALDGATEQRLWQGIVEADTTVLAVSHRPHVLERADRVVTLDAGRVAGGDPRRAGAGSEPGSPT